MSLATRCTSCGTIFRVVQDQLKISEGWVRCGRCDSVFNAVETLFDLEQEAPPPWPIAPAHDASGDTLRSDDPELQIPVRDSAVSDLHEDDRIASRFFEHDDETTFERTAVLGQQGPTGFSDEVSDELSDGLTDKLSAGESDGVSVSADAAAAYTTSIATDAAREPDIAIEPLGSDAKEAPPDSAAEANPAGAEPGFVQKANRAARWQTREARLSLLIALIVLAIMLTLQVAHQFRDWIATRGPFAQATMTTWCDIAGCRIDAPRRIEDISVESTSLSPAAAGTDSYRLSITLRNRGSVSLRMPSIDLTLTDSEGHLIARRALGPSDFGAAGKVIAAGAESPLQALISAGTPRVVGFTVEAFYP